MSPSFSVNLNSAHTQVGNHDACWLTCGPICVPYEDIVRFDVQVHHVLVVEILDCGAELAHDSGLQARAALDLALAQVLEGVDEAAGTTEFLRTMS